MRLFSVYVRETKIRGSYLADIIKLIFRKMWNFFFSQRWILRWSFSGLWLLRGAYCIHVQGWMKKEALDTFETSLTAYTTTELVSLSFDTQECQRLPPSRLALRIPCSRYHCVLQDGRRASPDNDARRIDSVTTPVHNTIFKFVRIECESPKAENLICYHQASATSHLIPITSVQSVSPTWCQFERARFVVFVHDSVLSLLFLTL